MKQKLRTLCEHLLGICKGIWAGSCRFGGLCGVLASAHNALYDPAEEKTTLYSQNDFVLLWLYPKLP